MRASSSHRPAHPRAGGENTRSLSPSCSAGGSSPRWRGKRYAADPSFTILRLIPALAGKTIRDVEVERAIAAHPRAGGENRGEAASHGHIFGSSPRWRGKLSNLTPGRLARRLIPALAGKTCGCGLRWSWSPAHPRAGGENAAQAADSGEGEGSSPRWRGKLASPPAVALRGLAHPRAGGENDLQNLSTKAANGSSPRWRGKLLDLCAPPRPGRLIPALAGKTPGVQDRFRNPWAHPRAGGENRISSRCEPKSNGSSPRWRGKPTDIRPRPIARRLIPALAGKTPKPQDYHPP